MEVAIGSNGSPPFQREVREWQRVDPNTGALLTGRLEADRWITGPQNAYGKVVDSQNVSQPNGIQHTQRKQLEVLQARTSSGSLQVVRAQTQTVQMSSSRWSSSSLSGGTKTTQSLAGQRFSIPLHMITNGGNHAMTNGNHESHHVSHNSNGSNHQFITEPSLKLSSLMKNSVASSSSSSRSSPRSPTMFGSSVSQRHHHDVTQPTTVRSTDRVGGSSYEAHSHKPHDLDLRHSEKDTLDKDRLQHLHRGRSISNDDLASSDHWDHHGEQVNGDDSSDWRRVSKIRRSFQSPKSSSPPKSSRPLDLPENSVSVSRIRQELENCRRLSTAMRNNHVDLVALDSILNGDDGSATPETDPKSKKNTFLTAESLKEIRGKLKKLSDESLYKEDFITQNDPEKSKTYDECQEEFTVAKPAVMQDAKIVHQPTLQIRSKADTSHNTNSLENRTRHRDTTSSEWYLRRKSYGFEKMVPPSTSMFRQESSTDSGIGRSGELASWSPTENTPRGTVITFGNGGSSSPKTSVTLMNPGPVKRYKEIFDPQNESMEIKRHSIAVDESKYVRDNLRNGFDAKTSINLNGFYSREIDSTQSTVFDDNGKRQKRVEFCKTEVHFAAESGRVNIVETDGKPPPTNNFRRRRRSSGGPISNAYLEAINSGKPIIHFGDNCKTQYEQTPQNTLVEESNNVTVITNGTPDVIIPCTVQEEEAESLSDEISIRGILKNKPVKPKPYHLGENIESSESLWGVRLRPVSAEFSGTKIEDTPGERVRIVEERKDGAGYSTKINLSLSNSPRSWEAPELPKSNVMTIELHSPTVTMQRNSREISKPTFHEIPTPQPRQSVKTAEIKQRILEETQVDTESLLRNKFQNEPAKDDTPLKIETGGTRKLRDHELLYFGVKLSNPNERVRKTNTSTSSDKYKKANEQLIEITKTKTITAEGTNGQKWKLSSDTPDLLRHSPATTSDAEKEIESIPEKSEIAKETNNRLKQGPVYENLQKPSSYNRRRDLERDEMILKEMNKEAEQALQAISTDKSSRDHHRRNSQRSSKPLETIDEKRSSKHVQKEAKSTPNHNSEIQRRRSCCSNRSSSISSTESLSRLSGSFRSKAAQNNEYVNMQPSNKKRTSVNNKDCPSKTQHRSSSRENHRTTASSSEDLHNGGNVHGHSSDETLRRSRRMKPTSSSRDKERDRIVVKIDENQRITRSTVKTTEDRTKSHKGSGDSTVKGGSLRSSKGEKTDKTGTTKSKVSSTRSSNDSHKMSRSKPTSAVVPSSTSSSSKRSSRHHTRK
ncbi:uncharacterized protein LOC119651024 isoform X7 [Hermetia illucens]|uniref:uncharacterized protein LOC119651024 isoform X7 n=1 Tax=Hermetia illucens TaxID=343691 RepID=UPI0018CC4B54|nr:uncharacterized protein LOC119651024 isoform X7 [Hermetia illucens]